MGAYEGLTEFFGANLCNIAEELGYSDDNICVLSGDIVTLQRLFPDTYSAISSCRYNKDGRTPIEYAKDVVASWLFEDYLVEAFSRLDRSLELAGGDRERVLLHNSKVSSASDCAYISNGRRLKVEIMNSYTPFWRTRKCLHLRDNKYRQLCTDRGVLLCVDMNNASFAIVDFTKNAPPARRIPNYWLYGGKTAYEVSLAHVEFYEFEIPAIIACLDKLV